MPKLQWDQLSLIRQIDDGKSSEIGRKQPREENTEKALKQRRMLLLCADLKAPVCEELLLLLRRSHAYNLPPRLPLRHFHYAAIPVDLYPIAGLDHA